MSFKKNNTESTVYRCEERKSTTNWNTKDTFQTLSSTAVR